MHGGNGAVEFSPDGERLVSALNNNTVQIWDAKTRVQQKLESHTKLVNSVTFSSDGRLLASFSKIESMLQIWSVETTVLKHKLEGHRDWVNSAMFSPDGR